MATYPGHPKPGQRPAPLRLLSLSLSTTHLEPLSPAPRLELETLACTSVGSWGI